MILQTPLYYIQQAITKTQKAFSEGGGGLFVRRLVKFFWMKTAHYYRYFFYRPPTHNSYRDVLFVNGCTLLHPSRYRVDHQIEQLEYFGVSAEQIFRTYLEPRHMHLYRAFVFYRCPQNEFIESFIKEAKQRNKECFFDIDDLIYDEQHVSTIEYVKTLNAESLEVYMHDVRSMGRTLDLCSYGITTTGELKRAMEERIPEVFINPNVASTQLFELSLEARSSQDKLNQEKGIVRIGYLSGSVTHNPDLELIQDALYEVAKRFSFVQIVLIGLVSPSKKLASLGDQLKLVEFVNWKKLPSLLASLQINVAPLENTRFNRAKSENKWLEAALVKIPTVTSDIGRLSDVIRNGEDGYLCESHADWVQALSELASDNALRERIASAAFHRVSEHGITQKSGAEIAKFIKSKLKPLYVFVIPTLALSGGMRVILQHAKVIKRSGADVLLYVDSDDEIQEFEFEGENFSVVGTRTISFQASIDVMVATLWTTVDRVISTKNVKRKVYLVQNYETNFYQSNQLSQKQAANSTYLQANSIEYLTISKWCQTWLKDLFNVDACYLPNGIDLSTFQPRDQLLISPDEKITVLVEGNSDDEYKNVDESMEIVRLLKEKYGARIQCHYLAYRARPKNSYQVDKLHFQVPFEDVHKIYLASDVLIKSSKVESFSYPPLEMMATGGLVLVAENEGNVEYAKHGENCMMYSVGNTDQAVGYFGEIVSNADLRETLIEGGIKTAQQRDWAHLNPIIHDYWTTPELS